MNGLLLPDNHDYPFGSTSSNHDNPLAVAGLVAIVFIFASLFFVRHIHNKYTKPKTETTSGMVEIAGENALDGVETVGKVEENKKSEYFNNEEAEKEEDKDEWGKEDEEEEWGREGAVIENPTAALEKNNFYPEASTNVIYS